MQKKAEILVRMLKKQKKTIAVMESCTGGAISNAITNIESSSQVFSLGAVTYNNEQKIKMGVNKSVIKNHSVYSLETAKQMSLSIAKFAGTDIGVGVTGKLKRKDENNEFGEDDHVFVSVYDINRQQFLTAIVEVTMETRQENKNIVVEKVLDMVLALLLMTSKF